MTRIYQNHFGRKPGRGIRPWFLLPKVLLVGIFMGTLAATNAMWMAMRWNADFPPLLIVKITRTLVLYLMVPSMVGTLALGVLLLLQHPQVFLRMRWLQVKLLSLVILVPSAHLFCSSRLRLVRQALLEHGTDPDVERQFVWGMLLALVGSIWIVVLGRLKPRLAQNWARAYTSRDRD